MAKRIERWNGIPIIDEATPADFLFPAGCNTGLVPRDYRDDPEEMFEPATDMEVYPESDWSAIYKERNEQEATLKHIWQKAENGKQPIGLYQNGYGYCWAHSTAHAVMMARAVANQPYKRLSAYMVAAIIKNYKNQGGWCGQSAKFIQEVGICEDRLWPQGKVDKSLDTQEMRANAALHRIDEEWRDLTRSISSQSMTFSQVVTALFNNQPCALDFNWWTHSVAGARPVEIERGDFGIEILNSHGENYGEKGFAILRGSRARPNGAIAIRSIRASKAA